MTDIQIKLAKAKFQQHRYFARKHRNIEFNLTFEEWVEIWLTSGHWEQRGCKVGQYCMSRYGDKGPYALGNVFIQLHSNNLTEAHLGKSKPKWSDEAKQKQSNSRIGIKRGPYKQKSPN